MLILFLLDPNLLTMTPYWFWTKHPNARLVAHYNIEDFFDYVVDFMWIELDTIFPEAFDISDIALMSNTQLFLFMDTLALSPTPNLTMIRTNEPSKLSLIPTQEYKPSYKDTQTRLRLVCGLDPNLPLEDDIYANVPASADEASRRLGPWWTRSGDKTFTNYHDYALHKLDIELTRRQKRRPDLTKDQIFKLMNGLDSDSIAYTLEEIDNEPAPSKSTFFEHKGRMLDVTKLSEGEIYTYLMTMDDASELRNLEHVRSIFYKSTPNQKVCYPEPFIASPSFTHGDIHMIHILQYQFWLWFMFIFLITFFFVSFLCVARWCNTRSQPRRETRGVSRSKCGDLITATVPITWAISIIVSESTDAADTNDGFSTKEIMMGIRAYQWGWEYYYPKGINLLYNLRPAYSAFIGNSLKYSTSSELSFSANNVWKQYQNKSTDMVITPAHLLVLPVDNNKVFNFMNLDNIGARTAKESSAFTQIRTSSKTFNTNLVHTPSTFLAKYKQINTLLENENKFSDSINYGLKRQHNLTASAATASNNANFLNAKGIESFLEQNLKYSLNRQSTESFDQDLRLLQKNKPSNESVTNLNYEGEDFLSSHPDSMFPTAQTKPLYPSSESILVSEQTIRHSIERGLATERKLSYTPAHFTVESLGTDYLHRFSTNKDFKPTQSYPIISNNPSLSALTYNSPSLRSKETVAFRGRTQNIIHKDQVDAIDILKGRREGTLSSLTGTYWQRFEANANTDLRLDSIVEAFETDSSYLPNFTNYYDYDFRNAQAIELLEESFWENSYSSYNHLDYLNITEAMKKTPYQHPRVARLESHYWEENTEEVEPSEDLLTPGVSDLSLMGQFYANSVQADDSFSSAQLINSKDFSLFPLIGNGTNFDESYLNAKSHNLFINHNNSTTLNMSSDFIYPQSYINVLNNFRADFDDFTVHAETPTTIEDTTKYFMDKDTLDLQEDSTNCGNNSIRFSNPITLRTTARNSIVTYNALQKVFKARFEEGRSNIKISHFSDLKTKQPFMNEPRVPYEGLLGKNRTSYYNSTFYDSDTLQAFNQFSALSTSLNTWFFDFPFLLGMSGDGSRHFWFDWFAQWGVMEVQPSSLSKYSTLGVPYTRKNYDFNLDSGEKIHASDNYLTRMSRARKNYIPNWLYTPYLYNRSQIWNKINSTQVLFHSTEAHTGHTLVLTQQMRWFWTERFFNNNNTNRFTPSISGNNIYNKATWRPKNSIQSYHYNNALLVDLLTKREFIYRQYFETNKKIISLPKTLTANPQHPLIRELKSSFLFLDPTTYNSEYSREVYYNSLDYFKYMILKGWLLQLDQTLRSTPINTNLVNDYLFYYFFAPQNPNKIGRNQDLYKSQFRPLKKGITTMLRLHATGAVALPIEIRLQILASSRDVIHSWAVPSAGVKIDCVPGYTSHRIMTFLTPGIYWGQCQEICGRYHHWMPIVVYFMKRDLFFLWCTHFMFKNNNNGLTSNSDRQFNDYVRFASHDKASWLSEISRKF